jgi:hypothetical protein
MAKPDLFRILGCVVMVTLILVIAVKLSKQCMHVQNGRKGSPSASASASGSASASATATPSYPPTKQGHMVCEAGFRLDEDGLCVQEY